MRNPIVIGLLAILVAVIVWFGLPKVRKMFDDLLGLVNHLIDWK